jgi:hypothetical protein
MSNGWNDPNKEESEKEIDVRCAVAPRDEDDLATMRAMVLLQTTILYAGLLYLLLPYESYLYKRGGSYYFKFFTYEIYSRTTTSY